MPAILIVALLGGCTKAGPGKVGPTAPDSASAADSGTTDAWVFIPPSVRILGYEGMNMDLGVSPVPASNGEPGVLLIDTIAPGPSSSSGGVDDWPASMLISGAIAPGVHDLLDLWDGVSTYDGAISYDAGIPAGDVDDDGHLDLWLGKDLFLGPLLGRALRAGEGHATIGGYEVPVAAGFDADGDGHEDVATFGGIQTAYVYHGPFAGTVPTLSGGDADPEQVTKFGSDVGGFSSEVVWFFDDHLGPGRDAIGVGAAASGGGPDTYIYELNQPRGARVPFEDAFATHQQAASSDPVRPLVDTGDINGDGSPDVLRHSVYVYEGPMEGDFAPRLGEATLAVEIPDGSPMYPIGDLNGDGTQELLISQTTGWLVIAFSPHEPVIDLTQELPLGTGWDFFNGCIGCILGERSADIDGDGLPDLVDSGYVGEGTTGGEARIWYGKDLLAAWEARTASR